MKDPKIRFSHQFETVPYLSSSKLNLPPPESVRAEANEQNDKSVDMTVLSQEESDEPEEAGEAAEDAEDAEEDEDLEFVLAIDDLQSAFAFNATDCQSYSLKVQKRKTWSGNLHAMYDNRDDKIRWEERKKVSEGFEADENFQAAKKSNPTSPKRVDGLQSNSTEIYNQSDLFSFLTKDLHLTLNRDMKSNKLTVKSKLMLKEQNQFFEKLSKELRDLAKEYNKDIDQLHLLFMEVWCDHLSS